MPELFTTRPEEFYLAFKQRDKFLKFLAKQHKLKRFQHWFTVSITRVRAAGGEGFLRVQDLPHPETLLRSAFPQFVWTSWRFSEPFVGLWRDAALRLHFIDDAIKQEDVVRYEEVHQKA